MKRIFFILLSRFLFAAEELTILPMTEQPVSLDHLPPNIEPMQPPKNLFIAVGLSSLFPGLGHVYLNDAKTAASLFSSSSLSLAAAFTAHKNEVITSSMILFSSIYSYNLYAVYRDARKWNGQSNYSYKMPTDSLGDLSYAPFNPKIFRKKEVWAGLLGALGVGITLGYFINSHVHFTASKETSLSPLAAFPVAVGEESFFRGFLQSYVAESTSPWIGMTISSLAFGAAHIPNARHFDPQEQRNYYTFALPFLTAFGAYFSWMTHKNHSLQESVALHCWYDFILFAAAFLKPEAAIGHPSFAIAMPF